VQSEAGTAFAPSAVLGHSVGEYGALVATGALELASAARLLRLRGRAMQAAADAAVGLTVSGVECRACMEVDLLQRRQ
jgi:[acyl-carrier-protein] S-malonyltransferase